MKNFMTLFVILFRVPIKWASTGLFGETHSLTHRCIVGVGIMIVGVNVAHAAEMVTIAFIKLSLDGVGYLIHGIGAVPFVDLLHNLSSKTVGDDETKKEEHEKAEH